MALKATIFKAQLNIADLDRHHYADYHLTLAQHPSENDERMMVRLLAFILNADEALTFTKGLSSDDEPDLWRVNLKDEVELWIELGQPDEKRIRKACAKSQQVIIYTYQPRSASVWWKQIEGKLSRFDNLRVVSLPDEAAEQLAELTERTMNLQCTIQDGEVLISNGSQSVTIAPETLKAS